MIYTVNTSECDHASVTWAEEKVEIELMYENMYNEDEWNKELEIIYELEYGEIEFELKYRVDNTNDLEYVSCDMNSNQVSYWPFETLWIRIK